MGQTQFLSKYQTKVSTVVDGAYSKTTVRLYSTDVVSFVPDGTNCATVVLNSGGYKTATTKSRMNQTSNQYDLGYKVYQRDFQWFVRNRIGRVEPFFDGMCFYS
jgi:hypothetical protein